MAHQLLKVSDLSIKEHKSIQQNSSPFDTLDIDLLSEILHRLPFKSIFASKCVSKTWFSLISNPHFIRYYLRYHKITSFFALYYQLKPTSYNIDHPNLTKIHIASIFAIFNLPGFSLSFLPSFKTLDQPETYRFLASSNGLVLCCTPRSEPIVYVVCNPLTKQWVKLPPPRTNTIDVRIGFICNSHDSCIDDFETKTTSFKVVRIEVTNCESPLRQSDSLKLETFCSETWGWCEKTFKSSNDSKHELFYKWNQDCPNGVACNGVIYWDKLSDLGVFGYDPYTDTYRTVEVPDEISRPGWSTAQFLGVSGGYLRYAYFSRNDKVYQVFELKDTTTSVWSLVHGFHLDQMEPMLDDQIDKTRMSLVAMHPFNGDVLYFWCGYPAGVVEYSMKDGILRSPCFVQGYKPRSSTFRPMFFSFVLPCWPSSDAIFRRRHR